MRLSDKNNRMNTMTLYHANLPPSAAAQKTAGVAALIDALTFIIGFALYFTLLASSGYAEGGTTPVENAAFLAKHPALMYAWNLVIYILFGLALVALSLGLHDRLKAGSPALAQGSAAFGLLWAGLVLASGMVANIGQGMVVSLYATDPAQAGSLWLTMHLVETGLGGGNEIAGGVWVSLVSLAALRAKAFRPAMNYFGLVIGISGLLTVVPALEVFGALFGLGLILWFVFCGLGLLRGEPTPAAAFA